MSGDVKIESRWASQRWVASMTEIALALDRRHRALSFSHCHYLPSYLSFGHDREAIMICMTMTSLFHVSATKTCRQHGASRTQESALLLLFAFCQFLFHFTVQAKQNRQHRAFGPPFSVLVVVYSGRGNSKISLFQRRYSLSQLLWKWMRKIHTELLVKHPPLPLSLSLCSADNFDERVRLWWCDAAHHKYRHPPPQYIYI